MIICRWGYEFGRNDQMQTLAYAEFLHNPDLYSQDFYIQGTNAHTPNERYIFSKILSPFAGHLAALSLVGHLIFSLLLLMLLYRISALFIELEQLRWLALLILFIPLYGINLGGNELYYNSFFVSNVVKVIGLAGIWLLLRSNYLAAFGLYAFATLLQPVVGIQLFAISGGLLFLGKLSGRIDISWSRLLISAAIWLMTAGIWIIMMRVGFEGDGQTDTSAFFDILFVFRAPHHYWPPSWPLRNWLVVGTIMLCGLYYYYHHNSKLYLFFVTSLVACLVYLIGVVGFHSVDLAALQLFKTTIWLKAFGIIAIIAMTEPYLQFLSTKFWRLLAHVVLIGSASACLIAITCCHDSIPWNVPYDFGWQMTEDPAVDISLKAQQYSDLDALFIHPLAFTELKYYGQRSSWVDYKVLVHTKVDMMKWQYRIRSIYGIGYDDGIEVAKRQQTADSIFHHQNAENFKVLSSEGITHVLAYNNTALDNVPNLILLTENKEFCIYRIDSTP